MTTVYHNQSMIFRSEDFVPRLPSWDDDPSVSAELKQELHERGVSDPLSRDEQV